MINNRTYTDIINNSDKLIYLSNEEQTTMNIMYLIADSFNNIYFNDNDKNELFEKIRVEIRSALE